MLRGWVWMRMRLFDLMAKGGVGVEFARRERGGPPCSTRMVLHGYTQGGEAKELFSTK